MDKLFLKNIKAMEKEKKKKRVHSYLCRHEQFCLKGQRSQRNHRGRVWYTLWYKPGEMQFP